ncbi:hypothetical protein C8R34_1161, partial [Nitrosomonas sp. Nm84]
MISLWMRRCNRFIEAWPYHWYQQPYKIKRNLMDEKDNLFTPTSRTTVRTKRILLISIRGSLLKISLVGMMCLIFQAHATNPAPAKPADTNAPAATAPAAPAAAAASPGSGTFDMSKVPFVTAASRPGLFMLPPTTPG